LPAASRLGYFQCLPDLGVISILNHSQLRLPTGNVREGDVQTPIACSGVYQMRLGVICFPDENPVGSSLSSLMHVGSDVWTIPQGVRKESVCKLSLVARVARIPQRCLLPLVASPDCSVSTHFRPAIQRFSQTIDFVRLPRLRIRSSLPSNRSRCSTWSCIRLITVKQSLTSSRNPSSLM
jgi:hypothetical protein